jgi:hypothetical protein
MHFRNEKPKAALWKKPKACGQLLLNYTLLTMPTQEYPTASNLLYAKNSAATSAMKMSRLEKGMSM